MQPAPRFVMYSGMYWAQLVAMRINQHEHSHARLELIAAIKVEAHLARLRVEHPPAQAHVHARKQMPFEISFVCYLVFHLIG